MAKEAKSTTEDREIVMTRIFNAPRELVFEAWTDPEHIGEWWGPNGFTTTVYEMDVRPAGVWRYMMHGPDGVDYPNKVVYQEVIKPERLVYLHGSDDENDPNQFHVTVTFEKEGKGTRLTMRSVFPSAAFLEEVKKFGAVEGGIQTLNRLEGHIAKMV